MVGSSSPSRFDRSICKNLRQIVILLKLILNRYEPQGYMLGSEYFYHAYGPIYALSSEVVASLALARNDRLISTLASEYVSY